MIVQLKFAYTDDVDLWATNTKLIQLRTNKTNLEANVSNHLK